MPLAANRATTRLPVPGLTRMSVRTSPPADIAARRSARSSFWLSTELFLAISAEKTVTVARTAETISEFAHHV